jgi:hypothetical protein
MARKAVRPWLVPTSITVHAPHSPSAQPSFAPVRPCPRTASRSVASPRGAVMLTGRPLRVAHHAHNCASYRPARFADIGEPTFD